MILNIKKTMLVAFFAAFFAFLAVGQTPEMAAQTTAQSVVRKPLRGYQKTEIGLFVGTSNYQGDVDKARLFLLKESAFGLGGLIRYHYNDRFAIRGNLLLGKLKGDDRNFKNDAGRVSRGFSFTSPLREFTAQLEWEPIGDRRFRLLREAKFRRIVSPNFFAGVGLAGINPTANFNLPSTTGNLAGIQKDQNTEFGKTLFVAVMGGGFRYDLNKNYTIGLEYGWRVPFTDYLDGISEAGNPDRNDWYFFGGLTVAYRFWPKNDQDGDGIPDHLDDCPATPGNLLTLGCPDDLKISFDDLSTISKAAYGVQFETSKSSILPESGPVLDEIAAILLKYPAYNLRISGHTDNVGNDEANQLLSESRARACHDFLIQNGVPEGRIIHAGYGETQPVADNANEDGRAKNRRVEFLLFLR